MIKAIIFDLDGVLVDLCEAHREALNAALKQIVNYEIPYKEHLSTYNGLPTKTKLKMLVQKNIIKIHDFDRIEFVKQERTIHYIIANLSPDISKIQMLTNIRAMNLKIACVTNSIRQTATLALNQTGQLKFLDLLVTNQDISTPKPAPDGYLLAMQKLKVSPHECLIVEDSPKGLEAAHKSGARVIEVTGPAMVIWENIQGYIT